MIDSKITEKQTEFDPSKALTPDLDKVEKLNRLIKSILIQEKVEVADALTSLSILCVDLAVTSYVHKGSFFSSLNESWEALEKQMEASSSEESEKDPNVVE